MQEVQNPDLKGILMLVGARHHQYCAEAEVLQLPCPCWEWRDYFWIAPNYLIPDTPRLVKSLQHLRETGIRYPVILLVGNAEVLVRDENTVNAFWQRTK